MCKDRQFIWSTIPFIGMIIEAADKKLWPPHTAIHIIIKERICDNFFTIYILIEIHSRRTSTFFSIRVCFIAFLCTLIQQFELSPVQYYFNSSSWVQYYRRYWTMETTKMIISPRFSLTRLNTISWSFSYFSRNCLTDIPFGVCCANFLPLTGTACNAPHI